MGPDSSKLAPPSLKSAIVKILRPDGRTAGTGLYVAAGLVVTCAHVAAKAAGTESACGEGSTVALRFHFAVPAERMEARVASAGWRPEYDVAILKISGTPPFECGWHPSGDIDETTGLDADCFGFGQSSEPDGATAECHIPSLAATGHEADMRCRDRVNALSVEPGFSGGPVYECVSLRVLGLVRRDRGVQEKRIARLILARVIREGLEAVWAAERARGVQPDKTGLESLLAAAREGVVELRRQTNLRRVPDALDAHLDGLEETLFDPAGLAEACEELAGLEQRWREAREKEWHRCFPRLGLDDLATMLEAMAPKLRAAPTTGRAAVPNDWDETEDLPHGQDVRILLDEIQTRLAALKKPLAGVPEENRTAARETLRRLRRILYGNPLSLVEIDRVRAELERFDRDVFALLILECQVFLGRRVNRLPPEAVFRDQYADESVSPELVVIPSGRFLMGSPEDEEGRDDDEGPRREVTIERPFALGRYPVTFEEYDRFAGETGRDRPDDQGWERDRRPVIDVGWEDARAYAAWLSGKTGAAYRLPSEAEWEYACRAGSDGRWSFGDDAGALDRHAWHAGNSDGRPRPVGALAANAFGLHDMHGNVWEWCEDCYRDSYSGAPTDGDARTTGDCKYRALRGGSWINVPRSLRSAFRLRNSPDSRDAISGFRIARTF